VTDTPSIPPALTPDPLEAVAEWVRTIAHNAYAMGHRHGQLDTDMMRDVDYQSAREQANDYARTGFDAETVRKYLPSLGFTQDDVDTLDALHGMALEAINERGDLEDATVPPRALAVIAKIEALLPPK
jgi:hypothetical protein